MSLKKAPIEFTLEISIDNKIRASEKGDDFYSMVPEVISKISSQYNRYRDYKNKKDSIGTVDESSESVIAKEKLFFIKDMPVDDAVEAMEVLGHQFYAYKDVDKCNNVCIVYKRSDGTYGLIECR